MGGEPLRADGLLLLLLLLEPDLLERLLDWLVDGGGLAGVAAQTQGGIGSQLLLLLGWVERSRRVASWDTPEAGWLPGSPGASTDSLLAKVPRVVLRTVETMLAVAPANTTRPQIPSST